MTSSNPITGEPSRDLKTTASSDYYYPYSYERNYYQPYRYYDWNDYDWYYDRYYWPEYTYWDDYRRDYYYDTLWDRYSYRPSTSRRFRYLDDYDWSI